MSISITPDTPPINYLDVTFKIATILIACVNVYIGIILFRLKDAKENKSKVEENAIKEQDRKLQLMKTLILDTNLKYFYQYFDEINCKSEDLKSKLTLSEKQQIDTEIQKLFALLTNKFYYAFLAIDVQLYDKLMIESDALQASLSNAIFDQGVNLSHQPKFSELIYEKILGTKVLILKLMFTYRGK